MFHLRLLSVLLLPAFSLSAGGESPSHDEVRAALRKATDCLTSISTEGGYLWRYSKDLGERRGETEATATQIWVQPPGTPSIGMAFLDAYTATKDERHLAAAQAAALALVRGQLESGGWAYLVEFDPKARREWAYRADAHLHHELTPDPSQEGNRNAVRATTVPLLGGVRGESVRGKNTTTFDDDNTQSALRFLMAFLNTATNRPTKELKAIRSALDYGLGKMLQAQYPNGAWPQRFDGQPHDPGKHPVRPARIQKDWSHTWPKSDYGDYYTLNDQTQRDCIRTMLDAHKRLGDRKYLDAARKGGEFLILARLPEPQPAWAQQYNFNMEPAWARAFEPPTVCSSESVGALRMLVDLFLETGEEKFLEPIPAFVTWLKRSEIGPNKWARYYELETNKPIYGDRDGKIHYTLSEISAERQRGYAWQGSFAVPEAIGYFEAVRADGRERFLAKQKKDKRSTPLPDNVASILSAQDSQGRWLANDWIDTRRFIANMQVLSDYVRGQAGSF